MTDRKTLRCAIYTRKSSEEGLEQDFNSLHAQRQACEAYVLSQAGEGWIALPEIYDDGGFSGGNMERPGLAELLADIDRGRIDVVVVYKVDRLTRSLTDFARIVERFDKREVSFVSVTQAFNTTSSMGRLTLNVLLSFAQFEREVTSERIRDKLAASKAKGMWMGGAPPYGYLPNGRTLKFDEETADRARYMFTRYLELGSVRQLRDELETRGILSRIWTTKAGRSRGGRPFERGNLFHMLSNPIYVGEIRHRDKTYPGQHPPLIDRDLFDAVKTRLARGHGGARRGRRGRKDGPSAPLQGLLRDDAGHLMSPVHTTQGARRYRYYVSSAVLAGRRAHAGSLYRCPAEPLETMVRDWSRRLDLVGEGGGWDDLRGSLRGVAVGQRHVDISWTRPARWSRPMGLEFGSTAKLSDDGEVLALALETRIITRGGEKFVIEPDAREDRSPPRIDTALTKGLARGEAWKRALLDGEGRTFAKIAAAEELRTDYIQRMVRLSFLAPDLKRRILDGRAPAGLTLENIRDLGLPDLWSEQRTMFDA